MDQLNVSAMLQLQRTFVAERKWNRFHTPKNLSMALAGEAAELMEIFQWLSQTESRNVMKNPAKAEAVAHEAWDAFGGLDALADLLIGAITPESGKGVLAKNAPQPKEVSRQTGARKRKKVQRTTGF